jgi:hypothetical protein
VLTGHSLGGALVQLCYSQLDQYCKEKGYDFQQCLCITFNAPGTVAHPDCRDFNAEEARIANIRLKNDRVSQIGSYSPVTQAYHLGQTITLNKARNNAHYMDTCVGKISKSKQGKWNPSVEALHQRFNSIETLNFVHNLPVMALGAKKGNANLEKINALMAAAMRERSHLPTMNACAMSAYLTKSLKAFNIKKLQAPISYVAGYRDQGKNIHFLKVTFGKNEKDELEASVAKDIKYQSREKFTEIFNKVTTLNLVPASLAFLGRGKQHNTKMASQASVEAEKALCQATLDHYQQGKTGFGKVYIDFLENYISRNKQKGSNYSKENKKLVKEMRTFRFHMNKVFQAPTLKEKQQCLETYKQRSALGQNKFKKLIESGTHSLVKMLPLSLERTYGFWAGDSARRSLENVYKHFSDEMKNVSSDKFSAKEINEASPDKHRAEEIHEASPDNHRAEEINEASPDNYVPAQQNMKYAHGPS